MKVNVNEGLEVRVRRAAVALVANAAMAAGAVHASPPDSVAVVPRTDLPALARKTSDATLLQESLDGEIMQYIRQNQGARLVTFDAPDPTHINAISRLHLDAPKLMTAQWLTWADPMTGALKVTHATVDASPALDYFGAIDPVFTYELNRMFDVKQVRAQATRTDMGTIFRSR
jgi:hypothetical protein